MKTICMFLFKHIISRYISLRQWLDLMMENGLTPSMYEDWYELAKRDRLKTQKDFDQWAEDYKNKRAIKYCNRDGPLCTKMYNRQCLSSFECEFQTTKDTSEGIL